MKALEWYDIIRLITIVLSLFSLFYLARRAYRYWDLFTVYLKDIWFTIVGFQVLLIEGGLEQTIQRVEGGPRTVIALLVSLVCVKATRKKDVQFLNSWQQTDVKNNT